MTEIQEPRCPIDSRPCSRPHLKDLGFPDLSAVDLGDSGLWKCSRFRGVQYEKWRREEEQRLKQKLRNLAPKRKSTFQRLIRFLRAREIDTIPIMCAPP